ncbi:MAG: hypothetical protein HQ564_06975 [Candidatus Saganbacteria bacterium]|nr:hypothetical protein [Candidatus Saganbacteria bacterium]
MLKRNTQLLNSKITLGAALLVLLFMFQRMTSSADYVLWLNTLFFLLHWIFGIDYFIRHIGPTQNYRELAFDLTLVSFIILTIFIIKDPALWFTVNAICFAFAVFKYSAALKRPNLPEIIKEYIKKKSKVEICAFSFSCLGAALTLANTSVVYLGIATLIIHLFIMLYLLSAKLYKLHP